MITKIDIPKFGLFNDYKWVSNIGKDATSYIFKKLNIIYGRNYSGKTTLSRIFRCVEEKELHENYLDGKFIITDANGDTITDSKLDCSYKIRVYNTDFVRSNLSILHDENGGIRPFALLGSGNVAAEKRINEIIQELGSIDEKKGLKYEIDEAEKRLVTDKNKCERKATELNQKLTYKANKDIKLNSYFVKQGITYNVSNIKAEIDDIIATPDKRYILSEAEIEAQKTIIIELIKSDIQPAAISKPQLRSFINEVKLLIEKEITMTNTIKDLLADSVLQEWVDKGRALHKDKRDSCAFCGGDITETRWDILDAHFTKESEELKKKIIGEREKLRTARERINSYLESKGIIRNNYYSSYVHKFDEIKTQWDSAVKQYTDIIQILDTKLQERYDDIFTPKELKDLADSSDKIVEVLKLFNDLSGKNNSKSLTLEKDKESARKALRYSELSSFIEIIDYKRNLAAVKKEEQVNSMQATTLEELRAKVKRIGEEKALKELELKDEGEAAKKVNSHLTNFFGHDGLSLEPEIVGGDTPQTRFVIKRGAGKAHNLSEGECSLIAFCYFIAKMEDELNGVDKEKLIIYIDDPIASLDNNHIFFMFSLIENVICKEKKYGQLFISTHNLDFLKYIKRLTTPRDTHNKPLVGHFMVIKQKKDTDAICSLIPMPDHLKDYVTEYNFLFKEIYNMAKIGNEEKYKLYENNFTQFYNLPNNIRKFLESYLFYRYPNTDEPLNYLSKIFDGHVPTLVNRVVNEYSHLSWGDRGTIAVDVNEAETVSKEILKAIKNKDNDHFEALCKSVEVDKNIAL
jgi:wobble nucleotide-excising tRNase